MSNVSRETPDTPDMQKLIKGLEKLKRAAADSIMVDYNRGVVDGISAALEGLVACRNACGDAPELVPGLDTAIGTLSLGLEMAKTETGQ
jgi:hypothetical protein